MSLESYESIQRMLGSISQRRGGVVSESTKTTFLWAIKLFCDFYGKTPDEIIEDRLSDWKSDDVFSRRRHEETVMKFAQMLREKSYSSNSVATAIGAVRSFYRTNYLPLVEVNIPSGRPERVYKIPTREELAMAIEAARNPWHRAIMVLMKDCGISLQDMLMLTVRDGSEIYGSIKQQLKDGRDPIHIHIVREKTLLMYDTFLGSDSIEVLNEYMDFVGLSERLFSYTDAAIQIAMKKLGNRFGWQSFTPYSLRKWFRSQLTLQRVNDALVEYWMGHSLGRSRGAYVVPPVEGQSAVYAEVYPDALKL